MEKDYLTIHYPEDKEMHSFEPDGILNNHYGNESKTIVSREIDPERLNDKIKELEARIKKLEIK